MLRVHLGSSSSRSFAPRCALTRRRICNPLPARQRVLELLLKGEHPGRLILA